MLFLGNGIFKSTPTMLA